MVNTIHLDTLEGLPEKYMKLLGEYTEVLKSTVYLDQLVRENAKIAEIIESINEYCLEHYIKGYHYTRADISAIKEQGLLCRSGEEIRKIFLENNRQIFTAQEWETIIGCWTNYFKRNQITSRDNRIFFNTTTVALEDGGAQPLFDFFGGEQIHMPLYGHDDIMSKLRFIGTPLIVVFRAKGSTMTGIGQQHPWGYIALSTFHRMVSPKTFRHDVDGYVTEGVSPDNILEIRTV